MSIVNFKFNGADAPQSHRFTWATSTIKAKCSSIQIYSTLTYVKINGSLLHRWNKATLDQQMGCRLNANAYKAIKAVFVDLYYRHYLDFTQLWLCAFTKYTNIMV